MLGGRPIAIAGRDTCQLLCHLPVPEASLPLAMSPVDTRRKLTRRFLENLAELQPGKKIRAVSRTCA